MNINGRLDRLEAAALEAQRIKISGDYYTAMRSFTDDELEAIENLTANDDLLIRWHEACQLPMPPEESENLDRIIADYEKDPEKLQELERFNEIIEGVIKRRQACLDAAQRRGE